MAERVFDLALYLVKGKHAPPGTFSSLGFLPEARPTRGTALFERLLQEGDPQASALHDTTDMWGKKEFSVMIGLTAVVAGGAQLFQRNVVHAEGVRGPLIVDVADGEGSMQVQEYETGSDYFCGDNGRSFRAEAHDVGDDAWIHFDFYRNGQPLGHYGAKVPSGQAFEACFHSGGDPSLQGASVEIYMSEGGVGGTSGESVVAPPTR